MLSLFEQYDNIEVSTQGKSNEWYTPVCYVDAARKVMGGIDLDPASCEMANQVIKANRYYTKEDNGLTQEWKAKSVWLNPPYGSTGDVSNMGAFTRKLIREYQTGNVEQAIILLTSKTDATWFQPLWDYTICFPNHLIYFTGDRPNKSHYNGKYCHIHGTSFTYLGPHESAFIEHFSVFGRIAKAIDTPKPKPTMRSLWE